VSVLAEEKRQAIGVAGDDTITVAADQDFYAWR